MKKKQFFSRANHAFTILEVVIVLAIASLITVIVLVAVRAANSSQRDTKRVSDALAMSTALEQFAQNSNGSLPVMGTDVSLTGTNTLNTASTFCSQNYLACATYNDPSSGSGYTFTANSFPATPNATIPALDCTANPVGTIQVWYTSSRNYQIQMCLERGHYQYTPQ